MITVRTIETYEAISPITGEILGNFYTEDEAKQAVEKDLSSYGFRAFDGNFQPLFTDLSRCFGFCIKNYETWQAFSFTIVGGRECDKNAFEHLTADDLAHGAFLWVNEEWAFVRDDILRKAIAIFADENLRTAVKILCDLDDEAWLPFDPSALLSAFAD